MTTNPKQLAAHGEGKPRLDLLEHAADVEIAQALAFGADKYGRRNYCLSPIQARTYAAAIKRHVGAWLDGEDLASDSGIHHLAHIGANIHVLFAAMDAGTFVDDRAPDHEAHDRAAGIPATHMPAGSAWGPMERDARGSGDAA